MADQISIPKLVQSIKGSDNSQNPRLALKLWLDDYDSEHGYPVSIFNIVEFELRESMFLKLPVGQFTYTDDGTSRETNRFYNGRLLYVGFEYQSSDENASERNISKGRYRILGTKIQQSGASMVSYVVTFVCDCLAYVNSVPRYPTSQNDLQSQSVDALRSVCSSCGIPFSTNVDTSDQMPWFNPSLPAHRFVQYVVNHSYISDRDFGMFWISKNGEAKFYGVRAALEDGTPFYFSSDVNKSLQDKTKHVIFTDVFATDTQRMTEDELLAKYGEKMYILFNEDQRNDDGWVSDFFGNSVEVGVYDPSLRSASFDSDEVAVDYARVTRKITAEQMTGGTPSTDVNDRYRVRSNTFAGYASVDFTHPAWEFSPHHNAVNRSTFFDNRHTLLINTGKQLNRFGDQEICIGDVLDVDFSSPDRLSTVDNGRFVVHSIDWCFKKGSDLVLFVRVASDSLHPTESENPTQTLKK